MLHIEVNIDRKKTLPQGAKEALYLELKKRLMKKFSDVHLTVRLSSMDGLSILNASPCEKEQIEEILQETWESANDWFQP